MQNRVTPICTLLFLGSIDFSAIIIGLLVFWIPGFFIARAMLKKKAPSARVNMLSALTGLLISVVLFAGLMVLTFWIIASV